MKRNFWLRELGHMRFAPITLTGEVLMQENTYNTPPGLVIGMFYRENGMFQLDIFEECAFIFDGMEIQRASVESSNIVSIGHDPLLCFLDVEFTGGSVYRYYGVKTRLFNDLMGAESPGKFLAKEIKGECSYIKLPHD